MTAIRWVLAASVLAACAVDDPAPAPKPDATRHTPNASVTAALELGATPLAVDANGTPRMMSGVNVAPAPADTPTASAQIHVTRLSRAWGVAPAGMPALRAVTTVPSTRGTIVRLRQEIDGIPVENGEIRVLVGSGGELVMVTGTLQSAAAPRTPAAFHVDDATAISRSVEHVFNQPFDGRALVHKRSAPDGSRIVSGSTAAVEVQLARAQRIWHVSGEGLVAAWQVEAYAGTPNSTTGDAFRTVIAASDGEVLAHRTLVSDVAFNYRVFAEPTGERNPFDGPIADSTPHPTGVPDAFYPPFVTSNLVTVEGLNHPNGSATPDPWLLAGRTETIGNNVEAYTDLNAPTGFTFGDFRATTTAANTFDRAYDTSLEALSSQGQQMAAITSLFYGINWLHDFWYDAGFTEAAGNGQDNNFGRGGEDRDAILAEAQDNALGGSINNANMSTPSDGLPPRMQVFVWSGKSEVSLTFQPANRTPPAGIAAFGPSSFDVTAQLVLGVDGTAPANDGCQPLTNTVTGRIVLVDRGTCSFKTKALNIQNAGGAGMIMANNAAGATPPGMGNDATITTVITIGSLSVTQAEGVTLKAELLAGPVTTVAHRLTGVQRDGGLDSTLLAHEYGHYLHHRLNLCGNSICSAMSEGWGDFLALMLMAREGDDLTGAFPFSVYTTISFSQSPAYFGIRRAPYSTDFAINSLSFRHMADGTPLPTTHPFLVFGPNSEVHNAGEIWAATLWEVYVALLSAPGADFTTVRSNMARYVVSGLLMAPVDPSPMEVRDALLTVASEADRPTMIAAFARRGMGSCAVPPPADSVSFVGLVENLEVKGRVLPGALSLTDNTLSCDNDGILDNAETATLAVTIANGGHTALTNLGVTLATTTAGITITAPAASVASLAPGASQVLEFEVAMDDTATTVLAGDFTVDVAAAGACVESVQVPLSIRLNTDDAPAASATDTFDATSIWTPNASTPLAWNQVSETALDRLWHGADFGAPSDVFLISPAVHVDAGPMTLAFSHRYSFEDTFDGGMIEFSLDNGATWQDVTTIAGIDPGYDGPLFVGSGNPLEGRNAFTGTNTASPAFQTVTLDFGTAITNSDVLFRFRIGTDASVGGPGWDIDDVAFTGITNTPFPALVADTCDLDDDDDGDNDAVDNCPNDSNPGQENNDGDALGDACDPDDDNDSVLDAADNCVFIPNGNQINNDTDTSGDACDPDDDNDTIADAADNCPINANTTQDNNDADAEGDACDEDDDNDTVRDATDNCALIANLDQDDFDVDGMGDACDPDDDNDSALDVADNCAQLANADQLDTDTDGEGDACDIDDDADGVLDTADNCALVANIGQLNSDTDANGDACDEDDDNDTVLDAGDNCPINANADQADEDGDDIGDVCDPANDDEDDDDDDGGCCSTGKSSGSPTGAVLLGFVVLRSLRRRRRR